MKKTIAVALTAIIATIGIGVACIAGCKMKNEPARQSASAYLDQGGNTVTATVDLSNGYSCEFARGAVYLYDQENKEGVPAAAMVVTLEEEAYNDYVKASKKADDSKEFKGGIVYSEDGQTVYISKAGDSAYFAIFAEKATADQMENFINRINVVPENY